VKRLAVRSLINPVMFVFFDGPECSISNAGHRAVYYVLGGCKSGRKTA